ncbi:MAG: hypothetical protein AAFR36_04235 [Bacteroidota bacterium]
MKRLSLCSILLSLCLCVFAQKQQGLSLVTGIDYLERSSQILSTAFEEAPHLHFRLGVDYDRKLSETWWIKTGLRLTHFRFDSGDQNNLVYEQTIPEDFGGGGLMFEAGEFADGVRLRNTDYFVEIPLLARFHPANAEHFYLEGGAAFNLYLTTYSSLEIGDEQETLWERDRSGAIDRLLPSVRLSAGWQWPLANGNHLFLQPTFRYFFPEGENLNIFSGGLEIGYRW